MARLTPSGKKTELIGSTTYVLGAWLGGGGYADVYRAARRTNLGDQTLKWDVAIKILHGSESFRSSAVREVTALAALRCPQIVPLLDAFQTEDGKLALVMPLVVPPAHQKATAPDLETLRWSNGSCEALPAAELVRVGLAVSRALRWAHRQEKVEGETTAMSERRPAVAHLDIKPSNILEGSDGSYMLADFGLGVEIGTPMARLVRGTPGYKAPEVDAPDYLASPEADIYSLGVTLWELGSGGVARADGRLFEDLGAMPRWRESARARGEQQDELIELVARMIEEDPKERPTAGECVRVMHELEAGLVQRGEYGQTGNFTAENLKNQLSEPTPAAPAPSTRQVWRPAPREAAAKAPPRERIVLAAPVDDAREPPEEPEPPAPSPPPTPVDPPKRQGDPPTRAGTHEVPAPRPAGASRWLLLALGGLAALVILLVLARKGPLVAEAPPPDPPAPEAPALGSEVATQAPPAEPQAPATEPQAPAGTRAARGDRPTRAAPAAASTARLHLEGAVQEGTATNSRTQEQWSLRPGTNELPAGLWRVRLMAGAAGAAKRADLNLELLAGDERRVVCEAVGPDCRLVPR